MLSYPDLSNRVIGLALEVHCHVVPGLLQFVYSDAPDGLLAHGNKAPCFPDSRQ